MYHPSRGGVRGGRDQFTWDEVKVDKHRENYIGHSIKAPVGRWQKGKDLHWYTRDKKSQDLDMEAAKEEIKRIKEEEEQAMREALGLAPKRASRPQGNRLDKHEYSELTKKGSTAEDLGAGHAEAAQVQGLGLYKGYSTWAKSSSVLDSPKELPSVDEEKEAPPQLALAAVKETERVSDEEEEEEDRERRKKRRREEKRQEKEKRRERRHDKKRTRDSDGKSRHGRDKGRHDSD